MNVVWGLDFWIRSKRDEDMTKDMTSDMTETWPT